MTSVITDFDCVVFLYTVNCFFSQVNKLISFLASKKPEQAEIVAFNRLLVNYNIHFLFLSSGDQTTRVDNCDTGQKNMEWKNEWF